MYIALLRMSLLPNERELATAKLAESGVEVRGTAAPQPRRRVHGDTRACMVSDLVSGRVWRLTRVVAVLCCAVLCCAVLCRCAPSC